MKRKFVMEGIALINNEKKDILINSEELKSLFDGSIIPYSVLSADVTNGEPINLTFVYANDSYRKIKKINGNPENRKYCEIFPDSDGSFLISLKKSLTEKNFVFYETDKKTRKYLKFELHHIGNGYFSCAISDVSDRHFMSLTDDEIRMMQNSFPGGITIAELKPKETPKITYINDYILNRLGFNDFYEFTEEYGHELFMPVHLLDRTKFSELIKNLESNSIYRMVHRLRKKDGEYLWFGSSGKLIFDENGNRYCIIYSIDITNEINTLNNECIRSEIISDNMSAFYYATFCIDVKSGSFYIVHRSDETINKLTCDEPYDIALLKFTEFIHPDDRRDVYDNLTISAILNKSERVNGHRMHSVQFRRIFNGEYQWVEALSATNDLNEGNDIIMLSFRNIHKQKTEEMRKHYLEVYSYALSGTFKNIYEYSRKDNMFYELLISDKGIERKEIIEITGDSFLRHLENYIHPDDRNIFKINMQKIPDLINTNDNEELIFEARKRDKEYMPYIWHSFTLRKFGKNGGEMLILFTKDINEKKTEQINEEERLKTAVIQAEEREREQNKKLLQYYTETIELLSSVTECRSVESGQHIRGIKKITYEILQAARSLYPELNLTRSQILGITEASALHDIGKVGIPDTILFKPGKLTEEEFEIMKTHTRIGAKIAKEMPCYDEDTVNYNYGYNISLYHHERYDGSGYPEGLRGDDIPFCAQVVSVADAFHALTSKRSYKEAISKEDAYKMIINGECGKFSPKILKCFEAAFKKISDMKY